MKMTTFVAAAAAILATAQPLGAAPGNEAADAAGTGKDGRKVLVLPYQPIYRSVAQKKVQTATDLLNKELSQKEGIVVIRGAVAEDKGQSASLDGANKFLNEAERAEAERRIDDAIEARKKSIEAMEKNAGAIEDAEDYLLATHLLARALMWAARDKEAKEVLNVVARMDPNFELPPAQFSRLYRKWFKSVAAEVIRERPGKLLVKSSIPGAKISMDGREMDVAPVLLKKVVPGKHLIIAELEGVPTSGAVVEVSSKGKDEYTVSFGGTMGGDAVGRVAEAVAQNELPKKAVQSAVKAGRDASAKFVVLGGLARQENHFRVHTFVVDVDKSSVKPLDPVNFDIELLTAESDVLRVVRSVEDAIANFSGGKPNVNRIENSIKVQSTVNEVVAAPSFQRVKKKKKKNGKRRVFKALKAGTIKIKDEEE